MAPRRSVRRASRTLLGAAIVAAVCVGPATARAADCDSRLLNTCVDADTFWARPGPQRFAAVGGTETVPRGNVAFGLVASYQSRPIIIRLPSPGPDGSDRTVIDNQLNATFLFGYGVTDRLELDLALPMTLLQDGSGVTPITGGTNTVSATSMRDLRFGATFAIVPRVRRAVWAPRVGPRQGNVWSLAARFVMSAPTGDHEQFGGDRGVVYAPSLSADVRVGRFFGAAEAGLRIRPTTEFAGARIGTQGYFALGGGVDLLPKDLLAVTAELRAMPIFVEQASFVRDQGQLTSTPNGSFITPAEWSLGVRTAPLAGGDFAIHATGGGWLPFASEAPITVPRFRFTLGFTFTPRGYDSDSDGVPDAIDKCPGQPGPRSSEAGAGCPEPPKAPDLIDVTAAPPPAKSPEPPK
jgi:hypothetical protein